MISFYIKPDSRYYWLRIFDKYQSDPKKKRFSLKSQSEVSPTDKKKYDDWKKNGSDLTARPRYFGTQKLAEEIEKLRKGYSERNVEFKTGIKIKSSKILSEAAEEYYQLKTRLGDKKSIKQKTIESYKYQVKIFIDATGKDVEVHKYNNAGDYSKLLGYFEQKNYAEPTRASITKGLASLWNYFVSQNYCVSNIIEIYEAGTTIKPQDIPLEEFKIIMRFYESKMERWEWVYYLLLTMNRPSTALMQERSRIFFVQKYIEMLNVKETRKKNPYYSFPLFKELEDLIKKIMERPIVDGSDRLFSHFKIGNLHYTDSFWWWYSDQKKLVAAGLISKTYEMKQIRKTFPSYAINELGMSKEEVQWLLDHTDKDITENHYLNLRFDKVRERFESKRMVNTSILISQPDNKVLSEKEIRNKIDESGKSKKINLESVLTKDELKKLIKDLSNVKIGKMYGVTEASIRKLLKRYNLKRS